MSVNGDDRGSFLVEIERKLKNSFEAVKDEFEDHLIAINENTDELRNHSDCFSELDEKIEKLNEKIDYLQMMMFQIKQNSLSENEQLVFDVLTESSSLLSCKDIAMRANLSDLTVKAHLFSMICKGVPIKEKVIDSQSYFSLEKKFRQKQLVERAV
ncbi:hypothetical protein KY308_03170 [Candidatus Woesearchaeota archaeon]|nr:hypothetical protein [Candidatus Woesearchaeota archaeon]